MPSKRELAIQALLAVLEGAHGHVLRNKGLTETIDGGTGLRAIVVLHDGDPGDPEVTLSPQVYHYEHRCEVDVLVQGTNADARFDALCADLGVALVADRSLGGVVDWVEAAAPAPADLPTPPGAAPIKAATIFVTLHYATPNPLT